VVVVVAVVVAAAVVTENPTVVVIHLQVTVIVAAVEVAYLVSYPVGRLDRCRPSAAVVAYLTNPPEIQILC